MDCRYPFVNTPLKYPYNALEPHIDEKTMILHHDRHLQTYVDKLNDALKKNPCLQKMTLAQLVSSPCKIPENAREEVCQNAGGVYNHRFYFESMTPHGKKLANSALLKKINSCFGSSEKFCDLFAEAALSVFGSGYAWLVAEKGNLKITTTKNQDTPLCKGELPIISIDVWEHAYYLKHYNQRAKYIEDWFCVADWEMAEKRFARACFGFLL